MFNTSKLLYFSFFKDTSIQAGLKQIQPSESKLVAGFPLFHEHQIQGLFKAPFILYKAPIKFTRQHM